MVSFRLFFSTRLFHPFTLSSSGSGPVFVSFWLLMPMKKCEKKLGEICWWLKSGEPVEVGSLSNYLQGFWTSQVVVWDFFHQQNHNFTGLYPSLGLKDKARMSLAKPTRKSQPVSIFCVKNMLICDLCLKCEANVLLVHCYIIRSRIDGCTYKYGMCCVCVCLCIWLFVLNNTGIYVLGNEVT